MLLPAYLCFTGCHDRKAGLSAILPAPAAPADSGFILIAAGINYDVIISPPPEADPWEKERVLGFRGMPMINDIFDKIYNGSIKAYELGSETSVNSRRLKELEKEIANDRNRVAKLQFTEDWYYNASTAELKKVVRSVVLGYEYRDSHGNMFGYKALFRAVLAE